MVSAGGASLFKSGIGCGACYQIKCTSKSECSENPVTVVMTDDECRDGCETESVHFDLSGTAFGAMAISGQSSQRSFGDSLQKVVGGLNPYHFEALVAYGDGEIGGVELKQALDSDTWMSMSRLWGAVWKLDVSAPLRAPLSLRVTSLESGKTVVATDVIPAGWEPGAKYKSNMNFQV
ncbi:hypothetical protein CARUB_v10024607mg [Capsella rubella]|uniref:Uncharacterized protein n=1 Tax=Capsella rubella TaxID=81985 RepID=R0FZW7_9BRAS|nr:hypothetical protein CARUB_v10024607mg [Capsella rubella]